MCLLLSFGDGGDVMFVVMLFVDVEIFWMI